jgi:Gametolysin peptidase M11
MACTLVAAFAPAHASAHGFASTVAGKGAFKGEQKVLVVPVTWGPQPATVDEIRRVVFTETDAFMRAASYGKTWLAGDVTPWQQSYAARPECDARAIAATARDAAAAAGFDPGRYDRFVFVFPRIDCPWRGLGSGEQTWINGAPDRKVVAHELGHTYGLAHANSWECGFGACRVVEYGDPYSTMGFGEGDFNVFEKSFLGWITNVARPEQAGAYQLDRVELPGSAPQAMVVTTAATEYWFELRLEQIRAPFRGGILPTGVLVRVAPNAAASAEALIYPEPNLILPDPIGAGRPALYAGETFRVAGAFELQVGGLLGDRAELRFAWTDATPPSAPRVLSPGRRVGRAGPLEVTWQEPVERGSGVAHYEVKLDGRAPLRVQAGFAQSPIARFRKPRPGRHTVSVTAVDRAGNRGRAARRAFVVRR